MIFRKKQIPTQPVDEFLAQCGVAPDTPAAELALAIREEIQSYASLRAPDAVFATHRIESDLRWHHTDSIDLIDTCVTLEPVIGITLESTHMEQIFTLHKNDGSVIDLIKLLLEFTNHER